MVSIINGATLKDDVIGMRGAYSSEEDGLRSRRAGPKRDATPVYWLVEGALARWVMLVLGERCFYSDEPRLSVLRRSRIS